MVDTLFRCRARATTREGARIRLSLNWALARRSMLTPGPSQLVFGDWTMPYSEIEDAVLVTIPVGGGEGRRLIICWRGRTYQFCLPSSSFWPWQSPPDSLGDGPLPFPARREVGRLEPRSSLLH